jgi:hypothetical protein
MGVVYEGPYRHLIDSYAHEGYAAARLPDGTLAGEWDQRVAETYVGYVPACGCGWRGDELHPVGDVGEADAEAAWEAEHLRPMIEAAVRRWPEWAGRVAGRAGVIAEHMAAGRYGLACHVFAQLVDDVAVWDRIATEVFEIEGGRAPGAGEGGDR